MSDLAVGLDEVVLERFVEVEPHGNGRGLERPHTVDGKTWACNGRIAIAVDAREGYEQVEGKVLPPVLRVIARSQ